MSLEVRQLVLRARVQRESDDDEDDDDELGTGRSKEDASCGGEADACEDKEALREEILAACRILVREELRALRER